MKKPRGSLLRAAAARSGDRHAYTLLEVVVAMALVATLATIGVSGWLGVSTDSRNKQAIADIIVIQTRIDEFMLTMDSLPRSLAEVALDDRLDAWGRAYIYVPFSAGVGRARRDRFLVPVNSLYDVYSAGRDGLTTENLAAGESQDDILRANDGGFVGLGREF